MTSHILLVTFALPKIRLRFEMSHPAGDNKITPVIPFLCLPVYVTCLYYNYKTPHPPPSYSWRSLSCLSLVSLILCLVVMTAPNYRPNV